jgi:voltage-gated potassium channel
MRNDHRFRLVWATLLLLIFFYPFIQHFQLTGLALALNAIITLILIVSIHAVSDNRRRFLLSAAMIVPAIVVSWTDQFFPTQLFDLITPIFLAMAFGFVAFHILRFALQAGRVDAAKVDAAICVYLLIGVIWQNFYIIINLVIPGSFENVQLTGGDFLYFSYITLSTLGYGDITPLNGPAQALAYTEAIVGQLYLTILVARLVGLHIAYTTEERANDG